MRNSQLRLQRCIASLQPLILLLATTLSARQSAVYTSVTAAPSPTSTPFSATDTYSLTIDAVPQYIVGDSVAITVTAHGGLGIPQCTLTLQEDAVSPPMEPVSPAPITTNFSPAIFMLQATHAGSVTVGATANGEISDPASS
jgi:hypothetical protein